MLVEPKKMDNNTRRVSGEELYMKGLYNNIIKVFFRK